MVASTILRGEEGVPTGSADTWAVPTPGASLPAPCLAAEGAVPGGSGQSRDGHFEGFLCDRRLLGAGLCPAALFSEQSLPEVWAASGSVYLGPRWSGQGRAPPTTLTGGHPHQGGRPPRLEPLSSPGWAPPNDPTEEGPVLYVSHCLSPRLQ